MYTRAIPIICKDFPYSQLKKEDYYELNVYLNLERSINKNYVEGKVKIKPK